MQSQKRWLAVDGNAFVAVVWFMYCICNVWVSTFDLESRCACGV
jgi:hypothetical protein